MSADRPADRIRRLVAMAASAPSAETDVARTKATEAIAALDTELLDTLAGQRRQLLEELREEARRPSSPKERATKTDTGDLVERASLLFGHYERIDALIPAVMLLRVGLDHELTVDDRQQLDGPKEDWLSGWRRTSRERRREEREQRRAKSAAS